MTFFFWYFLCDFAMYQVSRQVLDWNLAKNRKMLRIAKKFVKVQNFTIVISRKFDFFIKTCWDILYFDWISNNNVTFQFD